MSSITAAPIRRFQPGDESALRNIMERSITAGEQPGSTRHDIESVLGGAEVNPSRVFVADAGNRVVGFVSQDFSLLVVHPDARRRGHGTRLLAAALADARESGESRLSLASFGRREPEAFLARRGFAYAHSLWLLSLPPDRAVPARALPPEFVLRHLRHDDHIGCYVALITTSFADHPTPVLLDEALVRHVHAQPDFDPTTIAVVTPSDAPDDLIAFCRTSLFRDDTAVTGDIGLLGVLPEWRSRGLGRELLRWGVQRLRDGGATRLTLTVEARNERALRLYERHGFERVQEWPQWTKTIEREP
jgi:mycothiol synthase